MRLSFLVGGVAYAPVCLSRWCGLCDCLSWEEAWPCCLSVLVGDRDFVLICPCKRYMRYTQISEVEVFMHVRPCRSPINPNRRCGLCACQPASLSKSHTASLHYRNQSV